jgi:hypothetical protein
MYAPYARVEAGSNEPGEVGFLQGDPLPRSRAHALIGEDFFLGDAIVHGNGRIEIPFAALWAAKSAS